MYLFERLVVLIDNSGRSKSKAGVTILGEIHGNFVLIVLNVTIGTSVEEKRATDGVVAVGGFVKRSLASLVAKVWICAPTEQQFD